MKLTLRCDLTEVESKGFVLNPPMAAILRNKLTLDAERITSGSGKVVAAEIYNHKSEMLWSDTPEDATTV